MAGDASRTRRTRARGWRRSRSSTAAGIPTGILIAPLMPGINDAPEQVERIIELATEAGAVSIGGQTLFLRGAVREIFFDWLRALPARPGPALRAAVRAAARTCPSASGARSSAPAGLTAGGRSAIASGQAPRRRAAAREPAPPAAAAEEVRQERLF